MPITNSSILAKSLLLLVSFSFICSSAAAVATPSVFINNIELTETSYKPGDTIKGKVSLRNHGNKVASDLNWKFELMTQDKGLPDQFIEQKLKEEGFSLQPTQQLNSSFSYQLPSRLPAGNIVLRISLVTGTGATVTYQDVKVDVEQSEYQIFFRLKNHSLIKEGKSYPAGGGVNYEQGIKPTVRFTVENQQQVPVTVRPHLTTHRHNLGSNASRKRVGQTYRIEPTSERVIKTKLPSLAQPGTYLSSVKLYGTEGNEPLSNALYFRWVIKGLTAQVRSSQLDQSSYKSGETAQVEINYAGPPQTEILASQQVQLSVTIYNQKGEEVGTANKMVRLAGGSTSLSVPINGKVKQPQVAIEIRDGDNTLDSYQFEITRARSQLERLWHNHGKLIKGLLILLAFLVPIMIYETKKHGKKQPPKNLIVLFVLLIGSSLLIPSLGQAQGSNGDTYTDWVVVTDGPDFDPINAIRSKPLPPPPRKVYRPGDKIHLKGYYQVDNCGNGLFWNKISAFITPDKKVNITDCCGNSDFVAQSGDARCACSSCPQCSDQDDSNSPCGTCPEAENCFGATDPNRQDCYYEKKCRKTGKGSYFLLDTNDNQQWDTYNDANFSYGSLGDSVLSGDWGGDGRDEVGSFADGVFYLDSDGDHQWEEGQDDGFGFGQGGDLPVVGDWNGDGKDEVGVLRGDTFYLDSNGNQVLEEGTDASFSYHSNQDIPLAGDWDGDGHDEVGSWQEGTFYLDTNANHSWDGTNDSSFSLSVSDGQPVIGDWNGDGEDQVGVWEEGTFYLDTNNNYSWEASSDTQFDFLEGDVALAGNWNWDDGDEVGVWQGSNSYRPCYALFDQVKQLDTENINQFEKIAELSPAGNRASDNNWKVEYNLKPKVPETIDFSGKTRLYLQYSGTHWRSRWNWHIGFVQIYINHPPQADFTYSPASADKTIKFKEEVSDEEENNPDVTWEFGDGTTSNKNNPTHTYSSAGNYDVKLTVTDEVGASDSLTKTISISDTDNPNQPPTANYTYSPPAPKPSQPVDFDDRSSDPDGSITSRSWEFGDGNSASGLHPSHSFSQDKDYTVTLTVEDDSGATDVEEKTIAISNQPPAADFSYSPHNPNPGEHVHFSDQSSDAEGPIVDHEWDFGDGGSSNSVNPTHVFSNNGNYDVNLTVSDQAGATDFTVKTVQVGSGNQAPQADFTYTPGQPKTSDTIDFRDESSDPDGSISAWQWEFGDGSSTHNQEPSYSYASPGDYTVTLTVTDDSGAQDSVTKTLSCCQDECTFTDTLCKNSTHKKDCYDTGGDICKELVYSKCSSTTECNGGECLAPYPSDVVNVSINDGDPYTGHYQDNKLYVDWISSDSSRQCSYRNDQESFGPGQPCPQQSYIKSGWDLRDKEGNRSVYIWDTSDITAWNYDTIILDSVAPEITCDDCHQLAKSTLTFTPTIKDARVVNEPNYPVGFANMSICGDKSCSKVYCTSSHLSDSNQSNCSYSWSNECRVEDTQQFWIRARDKLGNTNTKLGGSFSVKKATGCPCSSDLECVSGWCFGDPVRVCTPDLGPKIFLGSWWRKLLD